jgi:hypothetical protein
MDSEANGAAFVSQIGENTGTTEEIDNEDINHITDPAEKNKKTNDDMVALTDVIAAKEITAETDEHDGKDNVNEHHRIEDDSRSTKQGLSVWKRIGKACALPVQAGTLEVKMCMPILFPLPALGPPKPSLTLVANSVALRCVKQTMAILAGTAFKKIKAKTTLNAVQQREQEERDALQTAHVEKHMLFLETSEDGDSVHKMNPHSLTKAPVDWTKAKKGDGKYGAYCEFLCQPQDDQKFKGCAPKGGRLVGEARAGMSGKKKSKTGKQHFYHEKYCKQDCKKMMSFPKCESKNNKMLDTFLVADMLKDDIVDPIQPTKECVARVIELECTATPDPTGQNCEYVPEASDGVRCIVR